jgi:hypothetical protein
LLSASGYLRPKEAFSLRRCDLLPPCAGVAQWCLVLAPSERGETTKTGSSDDTVILDSKRLQWMTPLLEALRGKGDNEPLWNFDHAAVARQLLLIRETFGIPDLVAYQARHSGASIDRAVRERPLLEIQKRGRWLSHKSVIRYEKAGRLGKTWQSYSPQFRKHAAECATNLQQVMLCQRLPVVYGGL